MNILYIDPLSPNSKSIVLEPVNKVRPMSYPCQMSAPNVGQLPLANSPRFLKPLYPSVSLSIIHFLNVISPSQRRKQNQWFLNLYPILLTIVVASRAWPSCQVHQQTCTNKQTNKKERRGSGLRTTLKLLSMRNQTSKFRPYSPFSLPPISFPSLPFPSLIFSYLQVLIHGFLQW